MLLQRTSNRPPEFCFSAPHLSTGLFTGLFAVLFAVVLIPLFPLPLSAQGVPAIGPIALPPEVRDLEENFPWKELPEGDTSPCSVYYADTIFNVAKEVQDACLDRFAGKWVDYYVITGHAMICLILPEYVPALVHEIKEEGKKDLIYCVFSGLVNSTAMAEDRKTIWKKNLNRFLEAKDTFGDVTSKMEFEAFIKQNPLPNLKTNGWEKFKESWIKSRQYLGKNSPEINNPSLYPIWNVYGGFGTLGEFTDSTPYWFRSTEGKFENALAAAKTKEQACDYDDAAAELVKALDHGRELMLDIRGYYRQAKKNIMCQEREKKRLREINGADLPQSMTQTFDDAVEGYKQKMAKLTEEDKAHVQVLRGIIDQLKVVMSKKPQLEQDKLVVQKRLKEAEGKMEQCDFDEADRLLQALRDNGPQYCKQPVQPGFQDEMKAKVKSERERTAKEIKGINQDYDSAVKGGDCGGIEDAIKDIDTVSTGNKCIKKIADEKIAALKTILSGNEAASKDLQDRIVAANSNLQKCDLIGATTMIEAGEEALSRVKCTAKGARGSGDVTELKTKRDAIKAARDKLLQETERIMEHAERAGENCDKVRLQADSEELAEAVQKYSAVCKAPEEKAAAGLARIRELLVKKSTPEEIAKEAAAIKEGQAALKACDLLGAHAAADQLAFMGKTCSFDGSDEANKVRTAADAIAKVQDTLTENISATLRKAQSAWPGACDYSGLRTAHGEMNRLVEKFATRCPVYPAGVSTDVENVQKMIEDADKQGQAAKDLEKWLAAGTANLNKCDLIGATTNVEAAQDALKRMPCPPRGARGPADVQALINKRENLKSANDKLLATADLILADAERAGAVCDKVQLKAGADKLRGEIQAFSTMCKAVPEKANSALTRINELLNLKPTPDQVAKEAAAVKEGQDALKACDVLGANGAADQLEFVGKTCSIDGAAEAAKIRSAAGEVAKLQDALRQNVSALRGKADTAWPSGCDYAGLRSAYSEINRVVEPYSTKCPEYPPGVPDDVQAVQKMVEDAQKQEQGEREKKALFDKIMPLWLDCKLLDVKTLLLDLQKVETEKGINPYCKSVVQQSGQFQLLSDNLATMLDSIDAADQLFKECASYQAIDAELRKAEPLMLPIETTIAKCNFAPEKAAIAQIRKDAKQIDETKKQVLDLLIKADTSFKAMDVTGAKADVDAAEKIFDQAQPKECFEDIELALGAAKYIKDIEDDTQDVDDDDGTGFIDDDGTGFVEELPEDGDDAGGPGLATTTTSVLATTTLETTSIASSSVETTSISTTSTAATTLAPASGTVFRLKEIQAPPGPPPQGWAWSDGSGSLDVYNGDRFQFTWTPPPAQIDSNGVTVTVGCQANPIPNGRAYGSIGAYGIGFDADKSYDDSICYCNGENGNAASAQKSVTFKPQAGASSPEITVGFQWGPKYVYKYQNESLPK